jgi:hypothetical protein
MLIIGKAGFLILLLAGSAFLPGCSEAPGAIAQRNNGQAPTCCWGQIWEWSLQVG